MYRIQHTQKVAFSFTYVGDAENESYLISMPVHDSITRSVRNDDRRECKS